MGQLESLMELDIAQSSQKKKKVFMPWLVLLMRILKSHDSKLVHFTHQGTCVAFHT